MKYSLDHLILTKLIISQKCFRNRKIKKIAPRIYSANFEETPDEIIKRNILVILGNLYLGAVLSHRSAFEFKPTITNQIFVTYKYTRKVFLPGRSEEHTSELQSLRHLVCRLLL